jgi:hypothetical protein
LQRHQKQRQKLQNTNKGEQKIGSGNSQNKSISWFHQPSSPSVPTRLLYLFIIVKALNDANLTIRNERLKVRTL